MAYGLSTSAFNQIIKVFYNFHQVNRVFIFGSRALGRYREGSDIDLAIEANSLSWDDILKLGIQLDDLMLGYSFDLVHITDNLDPNLLDHIRRVGILIFDRKKSL